MKMPGYKDQDYDPCVWLGLFFGRTQIQDKGQWEKQFCPFGAITTRAEQSSYPGLKVPSIHLWLMSNSRPFWSSSGRWSGKVIDDLRCLCIAIWIAPGVFWLPCFLPTDVAPVTTQPLEAALEREATNCFSRDSSYAGDKQLPSHCGLEGAELPAMFKCRLLPALGRKVISTKPSKQQLFLLMIYSFQSGC